jgi:hypothetical protein
MEKNLSEKAINDINSTIIYYNKNFKWYKRLWVLISNPFYYLFKGYLRY